MHSQVSKRNAEYFISEDRLADDDITEAELRKRVEQAHGTIVVCNVCGSIKEVGTADESGQSDSGALATLTADGDEREVSGS
jgi:hypothetical protein